MTVRRRRVLQSLAAPTAAGLTGCTGVVSGGTEPFEITDVDSTVTVDFPLEHTVSVHQRQATATQPAALAVRWQNNSDRTVRLVGTDGLTLDKMTNEEENLLFLTPNTATETTAFASCWIYTPDRLSGTGGVGLATLAPSEPLEAVSEIYSFKAGLIDIDECLPGGTYSFSLGGRIDNPGERLQVEIDWQLDVTLSR